MNRLFLVFFLFLSFHTLSLSSEEDDFFKDLSDPKTLNTEAYIVCNEKNQEEVLEGMSHTPIPENALHIGWSIEFNYKVIASRKPQVAIICDISRKALDFYQKFQQNLVEIEYLQFLDKYPEYMWATEDDFNYIKQMYLENRIHHICLNLMDKEERFDKLSAWIKENGYVVDTIYASNSLDWIRRKTNFYSAYFDNLNKLINENTIYIRCSYHRGMKLRFSTGFLNQDNIF